MELAPLFTSVYTIWQAVEEGGGKTREGEMTLEAPPTLKASSAHLLQHRRPDRVEGANAGNMSTKDTMNAAAVVTHQNTTVDGGPLWISRRREGERAGRERVGGRENQLCPLNAIIFSSFSVYHPFLRFHGNEVVVS